MKKTGLKGMDTLRRVLIQIANKRVAAWEAKDQGLRALGRWTDPQALLQRIYQFEHPEELEAQEGPGRQWQATWRGRFSGGPRARSRKAA
jgi:hypothetical protein